MIKPRLFSPYLLISGDTLTLLVVFVVSIHLFNSELSILKIPILVGIILCWLIVSSFWNVYSQISNLDTRTSFILKYVKCYLIFSLSILVFNTFIPLPLTERQILLASILGFPILGLPINYLILKVFLLIRNREKSNIKYALVAGIGNSAKRIETHLNYKINSDYKIKGFIKCTNKETCSVGSEKVISDVDNINNYLHDNPVDEIVIAVPIKTSKKIKSIINVADYHGVRVKYVPDFQEAFGERCKITKLGELEAVNIRQTPLDESLAFLLKNIFDKIFAFIAIVLLLPVYGIVALMIKLESKGPVLYCPIRIGKGGKAFKVYKFRSMYCNDDSSSGTLSTKQNDSRITKIGKFIRKYSIDELPQFYNVLLGNMSVVGPRPHRRFLNQQLQQTVDKYMIRHYFKPGITGWAQVNGWRGPTDTAEQKNMRTKYDLWYLENWSLMLDLKIIFLTIFGNKTHKNTF